MVTIVCVLRIIVWVLRFEILEAHANFNKLKLFYIESRVYLNLYCWSRKHVNDWYMNTFNFF